MNATQKERKAWRLIGGGQGIHWPDIEEDVSVAGLLAGRHSLEGKESFQKWIASRRKRRTRRSTGRGKPRP